MPIPKQYEDILQRLEKASQEKRVRWRIAAHGIFVAFPEASISLWEYGDPNSDEEGYALGILNAAGERIDGLSYPKGSIECKRLESLYKLGEKQAKGLDTIFDDIVKRLNSEGLIGEEEIPF